MRLSALERKQAVFFRKKIKNLPHRLNYEIVSREDIG